MPPLYDRGTSASAIYAYAANDPVNQSDANGHSIDPKESESHDTCNAACEAKNKAAEERQKKLAEEKRHKEKKVAGDSFGYDPFNIPKKTERETMLQLQGRLAKINTIFRSRVEGAYGKITKNLRFGGDKTISGTYSRKEFDALKEKFLGEKYTTNAKGRTTYHISEDRLRMVREPAPKPNNPRSATGTQANFQARTKTNEDFSDRSVHIDIDLD